MLVGQCGTPQPPALATSQALWSTDTGACPLVDSATNLLRLILRKGSVVLPMKTRDRTAYLFVVCDAHTHARCALPSAIGTSRDHIASASMRCFGHKRCRQPCAWHIPPTPRQLSISPQPRAHRHASCTRAVATATAPSPHAVAHWTCAIASAMCKTMGARAWSCVHARALVCDATGAGRGLRGLARAIEGAQWNVPTPPKRPHLARGECCGALIKRY